jgi:ADP-ribose pyrophosphatase
MAESWELLRSEPVLTTPWITVSRNEYRVGQGRVVSDYYVVTRSDFVLVVAQDRDRVILVREYRPATDRSYLAMPGGYIDAGEGPEAAARRELLEETGLAGRDFRVLGELHPVPAYLRSAAFVVTCEVTAPATARAGREEVDEVLAVPWEDALRMITAGTIMEMQAVAALLLANALRGKAPPAV